MSQEETKLVLTVPISEEQTRQQEQERRWYFQKWFFYFVDLRIRASSAIDNSKYWLTLTYGLLFAVIITRVTLHCYLMALHSSMIPPYEQLVVAADTCLSILWLIHSVNLYIDKWKQNYIENIDRASMFYIVFCMQYYLLCTWSVNALYVTFWTDFGIVLIVLFFAYGFLAEKSPNMQAIVTYLLFIVLVLELLIRLIICRFRSLCGEISKVHVKKELSICPYEASKYEQTNCTICLHDFVANERVCPLKCHKTHVFHTECLKEWVIRNCCCPCCRTPIT